jgi:lysophospholipase
MALPRMDRRAIPAGARIDHWRAPDGWTLRRFTWPAASAQPRGSMLFQGGRGDFFEKYLETLAHWHAQGWNIVSFDWRGQGGSGRLTPKPHCGHIEDYADYVADIEAFHAAWVASTPGPHVVIGHSMGGHLVLRAMVEGAIRPDAAVLVAPMLGFRRGIFGPLAERAARLMGALGDSARPAWKENEKPYTTETRAGLLTHDRDRYADELWWQASDPKLRTGPPSWRWVIEGFRSIRELAADPRLKTMKVPLLMLVAKHDGLVDARAALKIAPKLPDLRSVVFGKESAHEILREADAVRNRALGEIDLFLAARAPRG